MMSLAVTRIGASRAGHQVAIRIAWMARTDMPIRIEDALQGENAVGGNEVLDESGIHRLADCR